MVEGGKEKGRKEEREKEEKEEEEQERRGYKWEELMFCGSFLCVCMNVFVSVL